MDDEELIQKLRNKIKRLKRNNPHPCPICHTRNCKFSETRLEWKAPINGIYHRQVQQYKQKIAAGFGGGGRRTQAGYRQPPLKEYLCGAFTHKKGDTGHYQFLTGNAEAGSISNLIRFARTKLVADDKEKVCILIEQQDEEEVKVTIERTLKRKREDASDSDSDSDSD